MLFMENWEYPSAIKKRSDFSQIVYIVHIIINSLLFVLNQTCLISKRRLRVIFVDYFFP